jgi:signal transduction histidine kinase
MGASIVAGVLFGWAFIFLGLVVFFGLVWVRRREHVEFLLFALFALGAGVHAVGSGLFFWSAFTPGWREGWDRSVGLQIGSAIAIVPLTIHFGLQVARLRWRPMVWFAYGLTGLYLLALLLGGWWEAPPAEILRIDVAWLGPMPAIQTHPTALARSFYLLAIGVVLLLNGLLGRGLSAGDQTLKPAFFTSIFLSLTAFHDVHMGLSTQATGLSLVPLGYMIFAFGVSLTLVARYTRASEALEVSSREIAYQAEELQRSYDALQRAQGELVKREQLAVVGELAAVIAHEVRNPLAVISNAVAGLRKSGVDSEDRETLLGIISEESLRLNRLVGDLLSYARPVSPSRQPISLCDFVERSVKTRLSTTPGVKATFELDRSCPPMLIDPGLMRQVLDNLIGNAVQAMREEGTLQIRVVPGEQDGRRGAHVEIQDDGEGMDTQIRIQATTPFFTTRPSGTGLGLAIVDRIVEAHGGAMVIESRLGAGTTVRLFLPT